MRAAPRRAMLLPFPRLPKDILDAAVPGPSRHNTIISAANGMPVPITSVSLDTPAAEAH